MCHRKEFLLYLLMNNRCQDIFLQQFHICFSSAFVYNIINMHGCTSGTSDVRLGPEPRWPDAYQNLL